MLEKQRMAGPTMAELAASALTPELARVLKRMATVQSDGSVKFEFNGSLDEVADAATFLARLGVDVRYIPPRTSVPDFEEDAWEILDFVARTQSPVEIDIDGRVVHVSAGPAPRDPIDLHALAADARRHNRARRRPSTSAVSPPTRT